MANIEAIPRAALADVPLSIKISGLKSSQTITIRSKLLSEENIPFYSIASYVADTDGRVDLTTDASIGGYYTGVEPMGLIWSMKLAPEDERVFLRLEKKNVNSPYIVEFAVYGSLIECVEDTYHAKPVASLEVERWFKSENVTRRVVEDKGFKGTLFLPGDKGPYPGVIDMFGAKPMSEYRASLLASHGYTSLALNYFDFSEQMSGGIPLEQFEKAAKFLYSHPRVKTGGIGMVGLSLGGTISLLIASYFPNLIKCVVCINGTVFANITDFHYKGQTWKAFRWDGRRVAIRDSAWNVKDALGAFTHTELERSSFNMQHAKANFLFFLSEDDGCFLWRDGVAMIKKVMGEGANYRVVINQGAGHLITPPYSPCTLQTAITRSMVQFWGGNAKDHGKAQENTWKATLTFLRENLVENCSNSTVKSNL